MKSEIRVRKGYKKGTSDWEAQYDMLLDDGVVCGDCIHATRCCAFGYSNLDRTECDFYPNRFRRIKP